LLQPFDHIHATFREDKNLSARPEGPGAVDIVKVSPGHSCGKPWAVQAQH